MCAHHRNSLPPRRDRRRQLRLRGLQHAGRHLSRCLLDADVGGDDDGAVHQLLAMGPTHLPAQGEAHLRAARLGHPSGRACVQAAAGAERTAREPRQRRRGGRVREVPGPAAHLDRRAARPAHRARRRRGPRQRLQVELRPEERQGAADAPGHPRAVAGAAHRRRKPVDGHPRRRPRPLPLLLQLPAARSARPSNPPFLLPRTRTSLSNMPRPSPTPHGRPRPAHPPPHSIATTQPGTSTACATTSPASRCRSTGRA